MAEVEFSMVFIHKRNVTHCLIETYQIINVSRVLVFHVSRVLVLCVSVFIEFCFDCVLF